MVKQTQEMVQGVNNVVKQTRSGAMLRSQQCGEADSGNGPEMVQVVKHTCKMVQRCEADSQKAQDCESTML